MIVDPSPPLLELQNWQLARELPNDRDVARLSGSIVRIRGEVVTREATFKIWTEVKRQQALGHVNWTDIGRTVLKVDKAGADVQKHWRVSSACKYVLFSGIRFALISWLSTSYLCFAFIAFPSETYT